MTLAELIETQLKDIQTTMRDAQRATRTAEDLALPGRILEARIARIKRAAFLAILDEEEPRLTAVAPLFARLRQEIG